jgi:hypothetical protein
VLVVVKNEILVIIIVRRVFVVVYEVLFPLSFAAATLLSESVCFTAMWQRCRSVILVPPDEKMASLAFRFLCDFARASERMTVASCLAKIASLACRSKFVRSREESSVLFTLLSAMFLTGASVSSSKALETSSSCLLQIVFPEMRQCQLQLVHKSVGLLQGAPIIAFHWLASHRCLLLAARCCLSLTAFTVNDLPVLQEPSATPVELCMQSARTPDAFARSQTHHQALKSEF